MRKLSVDCADGACRLLLKKMHLIPGQRIGDRVKSWDVLHTIRFLSEQLNRKDPILDLGAFASEILPALNRSGFTSLTGIDLNPDIKRMPDNSQIRYIVGDFYESGLPSEFFSAITAISVIELGFDGNRLLSEVSRLLRPGGYFIASVDYWPDKIDTKGLTAFGLNWLIFPRVEIKNFLDESARFGFMPVGDLDFSANKPLISWQGKSYTFAWFVLQKKDVPQ